MAETHGEEKLSRPTPVSREVYIKFGNKCRSNGFEVRDALEGIMRQYINGKITF